MIWISSLRLLHKYFFFVSAVWTLHWKSLTDLLPLVWNPYYQTILCSLFIYLIAWGYSQLFKPLHFEVSSSNFMKFYSGPSIIIALGAMENSSTDYVICSFEEPLFWIYIAKNTQLNSSLFRYLVDIEIFI